MLRGLQASTTGMLAQDARQEVITQNLANINTAGFRRQTLACKSITLSNGVNGGSTPVARTSPFCLSLTHAMDSREGPVKQTGNPSDLALEGDGYFTVQMPTGEAYTRNGTFVLNDQHQLATTSGRLLLGEHGPITISSTNWQVTPTGQVYMNGTLVDRLKLRTFAPTNATPLGDSLWSSTTANPAKSVQVTQGALEGSNADTVTEMVSMLATTRQYEANQRCILAQDETLDHAVNDVGRV